MPCCVAVNCSNRSEKGFKLYCFPRNPQRRAVWAAKVKRDNWKPTNSSYLCEVCAVYSVLMTQNTLLRVHIVAML